jgi:predicted alpha/beta superfamily hydrolase
MPLLLLAAFCVAAPGQDRVASLSGDIRPHMRIRSEVLGNERDVWVYLPPGYDRSGNQARYPVLYLQDGQNVFDGVTSFIPNEEWGADETAEAMISAGLCAPVILVAVSNAGAARADEYLPTRAKLRGGEEAGGKAGLYAKFLATELKPFIDKEYRTKPGPDDTAVCGSSFGGIFSLHVALSTPETFGAAAAVSPSVWWDDRAILRRVQDLPAKTAVRLWVDMGAEEGPAAIYDSRALDKALRAKGWQPGPGYVYMEVPRGKHNERAWRERFPLILAWMFPAPGR